ncbi:MULTISPECIES: hypothetical protein [Rhizobium]|uniref:hypothetical protein n=1 Tax=Rhizobium phaseoli TaxID=396 RepID=UPI000A1DC7ED|nr:hypothetical protein [Rhizobium phaseoli]
MTDTPNELSNQYWRDNVEIALDENRLAAIHVEVTKVARAALLSKKVAYPGIEHRLMSLQINTLADITFERCIFDYFNAWFPDPIFDPDDMAAEASKAVELLDQCLKRIRKMPERSQLLLRELRPDDPESALLRSIEWFKKDFKSTGGRKKNRPLESALDQAVIAFEIMTGRGFKKTFNKSDGMPTNPDLKFFHAVLQAIDSDIDAKSIDTMLKNYRVKTEKIEKSRKERKIRRRIRAS